MFRKSTFCAIALFLAGAVFSKPAHALTCGQQLTSSVTLTADLMCQNTTALVVAANDIVIDLNGHTISCVEPTGYLHSCQNSTVAGGNGFPAIDIPGTTTSGHTGIVIRGPGTITGFPVGIHVFNGFAITLEALTITGPVPTTVDTNVRRGTTRGIVLEDMKCSSLAPAWSAIVQFNEITNQTQGMDLDGASCVLMSGNFIHDNITIGDVETSYGVAIYGLNLVSGNRPAHNNVVTENTIVRNGGNQGGSGSEAGMLIQSIGATVSDNVIFANNVSGNCGDGINLAAQGGSGVTNNFITGNIVLNNGTSNYGGQCATAAPGTFFDLSEILAGPGDVWANNTCKTKGPGIPATACQ